MFSLTTLSLPLMRKVQEHQHSSGEAVRSQDGEGKSGHRKVYILRVLTLVAGLAVGLAVSTNCYEVFGGTLHPARSVLGMCLLSVLALLLSARPFAMSLIVVALIVGTSSMGPMDLVEDAPVVDTSPCFPRSEVASLTACSHLNTTEFVALHPAFTGISREVVLRSVNLFSDAVSPVAWENEGDAFCRLLILNCASSCAIKSCDLRHIPDFRLAINGLESLRISEKSILNGDLDEIANAALSMIHNASHMRAVESALQRLRAPR